MTFDSLRPTFSDEQTSLALSSNSTSSHNVPEETPPVPPRREYVWRTIDRGQQSLASVARRIALDLDLELSLLNRLVSTTNTSPHRCAGYVREEITLATTTFDSAVVSHDAPSPQEICSVCKEVVGFNEVFQCVCGVPGEPFGYQYVRFDSSQCHRPWSMPYSQVPCMQAMESWIVCRKMEGFYLSTLSLSSTS